MSPINLYEPFSDSPSNEPSEWKIIFRSLLTSGTLHINNAALPIIIKWIYEKLRVECHISYQLWETDWFINISYLTVGE